MSTKTTTAKITVAAALAASAFGLVGTPAFAAPSPPPPPPPPTAEPLQPETGELLQPADTAGQASACTYSAYGYTGTFRCNTHILKVPWDKFDSRFGHGREEQFGIAPSGTIWHAWPHSGGWKEMPGHGRADDTYGAGAKYPSRTVAVKKGSGIWCNTDPGHGWGSWYRCR